MESLNIGQRHHGQTPKAGDAPREQQRLVNQVVRAPVVFRRHADIQLISSGDRANLGFLDELPTSRILKSYWQGNSLAM
jgi:hypothetical protein